MSGGGVGAGFQALGSAVGDLFSASADRDAAKMYNQAAYEAQQNVRIEQGSLITQTAQASRQFALTRGAQSAEISAAGFSGASGTAQALQFAGTSQYGVNLQNITSQNIIQQNAYTAQMKADQSMAAQENEKAEAADIGGVFSGIAAVADFASAAAA
jgi:hypothetical protein